MNIPTAPDSKMANALKNADGTLIYRELTKKKLLVLCLLFVGTLVGFLLNLVVGSSDLSIWDAVAVLAGGRQRQSHCGYRYPQYPTPYGGHGDPRGNRLRRRRL